jgi:hypothetical protein
LAKDNNFGAEALIADCGGEQALLVFSGEDEAEMPVWLKGAFEDGWRVRETSTGELVSGMVALDPSPEMAAETIHLVSLRGRANRLWFAGGSALPTVANPALSDEPPNHYDHVRERDPEV